MMQRSRQIHTIVFSRSDYGFFGLLLFVQLGFSFWISVQALSAALFVVRFWKVIAKSFADTPQFLLVIPFMYVQFLMERSTDVSYDLLRISREAMFYAFSAAIFNSSRVWNFELSQRKLEKMIRYIAIFLLGLTMLQTVALKAHTYIGVPATLFAHGGNTVADKATLIYTHVRPAGVFSEPSYMGFVLLALLFMNQAFYRPGGSDRVTTGMLVAAGVLTQSFSFVFFFGLMTVFAAYSMEPFRRYRVGIMLTGVVGLVIAGVFAGSVIGDSRLAGLGTSNGDASFFVRIFGPFSALPSYVLSHPAGVPWSDVLFQIEEYSAQYNVDPLQYEMNGFFNSFFNYGLIGIFLSYFYFARTDKIFSFFLFFCSMFNGSIFGPDKFFVLSMTYIIHRYAWNRGFVQPGKARGLP